MTALASRFALAGWQGLSPTMAASSEATGYGVGNLASQRLDAQYRSVAGVVTSVVLDFDLGSTLEVGVVALGGTNLSDTATVKVDYSTIAAGGVDVGTSGTINAFDTSLPVLRSYRPPWGPPMIVLPDPSLNARYVRVTLNDSSNADGYIRASYRVVEKLWQPGINFDATWQKNDEIVGSPGSQVVRRGHVFNFHRLTENEEHQVLNLARVIMQNGRVLVIPRAKSGATWLSEAFFGFLEAMPTSTPFNSRGNLRVVPMSFREADE